jgi:hypothetical protein
MKNLITKLFASLDTHSLGFSGRKLTALFSILMGAYITIFKLRPEDYFTALVTWVSVALLCLGIVTIQNIIEFKNGKDDKANTI